MRAGGTPFHRDQNDCRDQQSAQHAQVAGRARIGIFARIMRDDAAVVYLNGMEVWRDTNITSGTISNTTPATVALGGADESAWLSFPLNPAALVSGTNLLAIEVHQNAVTSSDLIMNFDLTGTLLLPSATKILPLF